MSGFTRSTFCWRYLAHLLVLVGPAPAALADGPEIPVTFSYFMAPQPLGDEDGLRPGEELLLLLGQGMPGARLSSTDVEINESGFTAALPGYASGRCEIGWSYERMHISDEQLDFALEWAGDLRREFSQSEDSEAVPPLETEEQASFLLGMEEGMILRDMEFQYAFGDHVEVAERIELEGVRRSRAYQARAALIRGSLGEALAAVSPEGPLSLRLSREVPWGEGDHTSTTLVFEGTPRVGEHVTVRCQTASSPSPTLARLRELLAQAGRLRRPSGVIVPLGRVSENDESQGSAVQADGGTGARTDGSAEAAF